MMLCRIVLSQIDSHRVTVLLLNKEVKERLASVRAFATALEEACKAASSGRMLSMLASDSPREYPVEAEQKSY